jgi:hypothetical protein
MKRSTGLASLTGCVVAVALFMAWVPHRSLYDISGVHLADGARDVHALWPDARESVDAKGRTWLWQGHTDYNAGARLWVAGHVVEVVGYELHWHGQRFGDGDVSPDGQHTWEALQKLLGRPLQHQICSADNNDGATDEYEFDGGLRVRVLERKGKATYMTRYFLGPDG